MDTRPIGFMDSGLGGVSVLREARRILPHENFLYYGDNGNAPYGDRTTEDICALTVKAVEALVDNGAKAVVIACNTATAASIETLRKSFSVPILGIEPAITPACRLAGDGKVLMLATASTSKSARYLALRDRQPDPARVISVGCPGLVQRIERGIFDDDAFDDILSEHLAPYNDTRVDAIVLGCTHYPFIRGAFRRYAEAHFVGKPQFFDGGEGVSRHLKNVLEQNGLVNGAGDASVTLMTSGDMRTVRPLFELLLNR